MEFLSEVEFEKPVQIFCMVSQNDAPHFAVLAWVDRERRYFISSTGTTKQGLPVVRERWRQIEGEAQRITTTTTCPEMLQTYYGVCSMIDRHNRCRQDDLRMEKKVETKDWSFRVNFSLLSICVVDSWLLFNGVNAGRSKMSQTDFYAM